MRKFYILWLFGDRNINIEKYFLDAKKLFFMEDINFKQFFYVLQIFNLYKGRDNLYNIFYLNFKST